MNKDWSNLNKEFQVKIAKKATFKDGITKLLELRKQLFDMIQMVRTEFPEKEYSLQPLMNAKGYEAKTMAYSLYHIARIEDICLHTLLLDKEQIFFQNNYQALLNSTIITTGNELKKEEIQVFSSELNIDMLYQYITQVYHASNEYITSLDFEDLKKKTPFENKEKLIETHSVSEDIDSYWLIDYWCTKDVLGLLKMPFSRHWIMHIEAFLRIKNTIIAKEKKKD